MKKVICILLTLLYSCDSADDSIKTRKHIFSVLKNEDNVTFPMQLDVLEEKDTIDSKKHLYNASFRLKHKDILDFIRRNKLLRPDTSKSIFVPTTIMYIKERPRFYQIHELKTNSGLELYADTTTDKVFISKYYN